jgi:hypothetical protein
VYEVGRKALGGLPEALSSMSSTRPPAKESPSGAPVAHACNPSYSGGREVGGSRLDATPGKWFARSYLENPSEKRAGRGAQVVERRPSEGEEDLRSNPSLA